MTHTALVVEDDAALRIFYTTVLERLDYTVTTAVDGQAALDELAAHTPDLIFLDMRLPMISGETVLHHIADTPALHSAYIVIASSSKEFGKYTTHVPSAEFLLKPVMPSQIREIATRVLHSSSMR